MRRALHTLFLSLIFFAGCVRIPEDEAYCKIDPVPCLEKTRETALESVSFTEGEFPEGNWWEMFDDPKLSELICTALSCNPTLQVAMERVKQAEAGAKIKRSYLFPTIGFDAQVNWRYLGRNDFFRAYTPVIPANVPEWILGVDFTYEFDFWGKNRNTFRSALSLAKAEEAERCNAILMLSTSVAAVYFKLQANYQQLKLLKDERKILTKLFQLTKERQENALDNSMQRLSAEEQLFIINKNILITKQKITLNTHMLNVLLGFGPDTKQEFESIAFPSRMDFPLPKHISSNLLARRPDLMAYIWRIESAAHLVGAAKADFYPRIDLAAFAGLDSVFLNKLFTQKSFSANIVPALYLPIFTAGRIKANLRQKQAEFNEWIYAYNNAVLQAVKEVADQIVTLNIVNEKLAVEEMLVANRIQNRKIIAQRYNNALANLLDLLQSQDEVLQQEFEKIHLQYKRAQAAIHLIKALGGGYCTEEVMFDN